ncbi:phage regulatory CII family protein [Ruegeria sp. HKCCC1038]|uniref:phage regulatory CII family protein n=1 Tax=Ruegeria sp. HKCCC1038 TaxID=2682982 RepID=UPI0014891CC1|nr:phage regulatory CII family protein [Ruegeria sp. HKCCC1038]
MRGEEFASLVHRILTTESRYNSKDVAAQIGLEYDAFYARMRNRTVFSANEIKELIRAMPDARLVAYLLEETRFVAADRIENEDCDEEEHLYRATNRIVLEAAEVMRAMHQALSDQRVDHQEALQILSEIDEAERALVSLRVQITELNKDRAM